MILKIFIKKLELKVKIVFLKKKCKKHVKDYIIYLNKNCNNN